MKKWSLKNIFIIIAVGLLMAMGVNFSHAAAETADEMISRVRKGVIASPNRDYDGTISKRGVKPVPYKMSTRDNLIIFQYSAEGASERFDMRYKDTNLQISVYRNGKKTDLPLKDYANAIGGTDVSYEDLSMRFLYWKGGVFEKNERVKGRECRVVQLKNPNPKTGGYAWVRVWVGVDDGAIWRIDGYDANGELVKRFILNSVTKLDDGSWFFKEMKLEVLNPATRKVVATSSIKLNSTKNI